MTNLRWKQNVMSAKSWTLTLTKTFYPSQILTHLGEYSYSNEEFDCNTVRSEELNLGLPSVKLSPLKNWNYWWSNLFPYFGRLDEKLCFVPCDCEHSGKNFGYSFSLSLLQNQFPFQRCWNVGWSTWCYFEQCPSGKLGQKIREKAASSCPRLVTTESATQSPLPRNTRSSNTFGDFFVGPLFSKLIPFHNVIHCKCNVFLQ